MVRRDSKPEPSAEAHRPGLAEDSSPISRVRSWLHTQYPSWEAGDDLGPTRLAVLGGHRPGRATLMVFRGRERWPSIAVKLVTTPEDATHLSREAKSLDLANRELAGLMALPPPRHLGSIHERQFAALAITTVRGTRANLPDLTKPKPTRRDVRSLKSHVHAVRHWSRSLREATVSDSATRDGRHLVDRIHRFIDLGDLPDDVIPRFQSLAVAMGRYPAKWSPRWQHGDVAPGNVLWRRGGIRLVDWEAASPSHDPWRDDSYLILSLARAAQHETAAPSVAAALRTTFGSGRWAGQVAESSYREDWPHPIPVSWAVMATTVEHALEGEEYGTTTSFWRDLAVDLLVDEELREMCKWLVPRW